jgi:hypothetical protein
VKVAIEWISSPTGRGQASDEIRSTFQIHDGRALLAFGEDLEQQSLTKRTSRIRFL